MLLEERGLVVEKEWADENSSCKKMLLRLRPIHTTVAEVEDSRRPGLYFQCRYAELDHNFL